MKSKLSQRVLGNPRIVAAIAACLVLTAGCTNSTDTPQSSGKQVSTPTTIETPIIKETIPNPAPTPTITKQAEDEPVTTGWKSAQQWNPSICSTKNTASVAMSKVCEYLNSNLIELESIVFATAANSEEVALEMQAESGYELHSWNDEYNPIVERKDACVVYNDKSVSCHQKTEEQIVRTPQVITVSSSSLEAVLTGADPDSRINLRKTPNTNGKYLGYGLVGDRVEVTEQTTGTDGDTWYKVHFPQSDARGWIHVKFVNVVSTDETSQPTSETSDYSSETTSETSSYPTYSASSGSSGRCNSPEDIDSAGHRCGGRSASSRRRRR